MEAACRTTPPAFTLLEGGGVRSARLAMLLRFMYLKLRCFVRGSGQPRTDTWFWVLAEVHLSGPNSVNAYVVCSNISLPLTYHTRKMLMLLCQRMKFEYYPTYKTHFCRSLLKSCRKCFLLCLVLCQSYPSIWSGQNR